MRYWIVPALAAAALVAAGCKEMISPHVAPEANTESLVAGMVAATNDAIKARTDAQRRITLTLNNAPEANEPLEQDFITEMVELFEKRHPDIQIQYSPWQYTPESFFERVKNRTLTDVVEVDAEQMTPIILENCAADLTENIKLSPEIRVMNPEVFRTTSKDNRTYGVPLELHTMALFFNRRLLANTTNPPKLEKKTSETTATEASEPQKGKGADDDPRDFLQDEPMVLAQYAPQQQQYYPPQNAQQSRRTGRRGEQEVENYYGQQPRQRGRFGGQQQQQQPQQYQQQPQYQYPPGYYQQQPQYQQYPGQQQGPRLYAPPEEDARARRVKSRKRDEESTVAESAKRRPKKSEETTDSETAANDTLTTEAELALLDQRTSDSDSVTSVIETANLPADWDQFIRLAVRLTDHKKGVYGYGPVLYASEGGREFSQWSVLGGLQVQQIEDSKVTLDIHSRAAGEVAQFIKDLHWRFDVTPPPSKCYFQSLMGMFAESKLAMMMLPADAATLAELQRLGMALDDIGIAPLPAGPNNRNHLTYGKCLIINSQLDRDKREAAFKWVMFMASAEVKRLRTQFFFREKEPTGVPEVPLYTPEMQHEYWASIAPFRSLPRYGDYEAKIARNLTLAPPYYTERLYEAIAEGVRPIIEQKDSDPYQSMTQVAVDFERKYLLTDKPSNVFEFYYRVVTEGE